MSGLFRVCVLLAAASGCGDAEGSRLRGAGSGTGQGAPIATPEDSIVVEAERALAQGRPWHATELLVPVLADSARRTPSVVLLAATAAAEWRGWRQVRDLLAGAPWIDSVDAGRGRELLTRAALGLADDSTAATDAAIAVATARDDRDRGTRLVLLARAL